MYNQQEARGRRVTLQSGLFHNGKINKQPVMVQRMTWHRTGDKPLSEPIMGQFYDADFCHSFWMD